MTKHAYFLSVGPWIPSNMGCAEMSQDMPLEAELLGLATYSGIYISLFLGGQSVQTHWQQWPHSPSRVYALSILTPSTHQHCPQREIRKTREGRSDTSNNSSYWNLG